MKKRFVDLEEPLFIPKEPHEWEMFYQDWNQSLQNIINALEALEPKAANEVPEDQEDKPRWRPKEFLG